MLGIEEQNPRKTDYKTSKKHRANNTREDDNKYITFASSRVAQTGSFSFSDSCVISPFRYRDTAVYDRIR